MDVFGSGREGALTDQQREKSKILENVADEVIGELNDEEVRYVRLNPQIFVHHFGLALYIRNKYIYSGKIGFQGEPDNVSSEIMRIVIRKVLPEYDEIPLLLDLTDRNDTFGTIHYSACALNDWAPYLAAAKDSYALLQQAHRLRLDHSAESCPDADDIRCIEEMRAAREEASALEEEVVRRITEALWDFNVVKAEASRLGIAHENVLAFESFCRVSLSGEFDETLFVPSSIGLLGAFDRLPQDVRNAALGELGAVLQQHPSEEWIEHVPPFIFSCRDVAEYALSKDGRLLQVMPQWSSDKELVCEAVGSACEAIEYADERYAKDVDVIKAAFPMRSWSTPLADDPYRAYNDNDEIVKLAIRSNPQNLAFASRRLRDNVGMALLAVGCVKDHHVENFYEKMSERVRSDRRVVLAIARCEQVPYSFPPKEYRDDDEVGSLLADEAVHGDHFALIRMSRRIKERYMTDDELDIWGDDEDEGA